MAASNFWQGKNVLVTGGGGFLGQHVVNKISKKNPAKILIPRSDKFDLRTLEVCRKVTQDMDIIVHLAAKVGGIGFNMQNPGELFYDNLIMGVQLMEEARKAGV